MEYLKSKKRHQSRVSFSRVESSAIQISNKYLSSNEEDLTNRSKADYSDSEYLESGIVSKTQSPLRRSPPIQNETETLINLSSVTESGNFSEISLQGDFHFSIDKIITNTSSFANEDSTGLGKNLNSSSIQLNFLPVIGCMPTTVYCWTCKKYIHSQIDFLNEKFSTKILKLFSKVLPFCDFPLWSNEEIVHKCSKCNSILAKGRVNE
jgi:hypothetical protein